MVFFHDSSIHISDISAALSNLGPSDLPNTVVTSLVDQADALETPREFTIIRTGASVAQFLSWMKTLEH